MKCLHRFVMIALLVVPAVFADPPSSIESDLLKTEREWADSIVHKDKAGMDRIMGNDWTITLPDGKVQTKAEAQESFDAADYSVESIRLEDLKVRVFGETAVVTGLATFVNEQVQGQRQSSTERFTDVFVERGEHWQAVVSHVSYVHK